jgi:hypothetical protein
MRDEQGIKLADEVKRIERELYLKKSQLAATQAREQHTDLGVVGVTLDASEFKQAFSKIIEEVGLQTEGGNSVEDIARERQR